MRLIDIVNGPWAIRPQMLEEIQRIYASHLHRAEKIDISAIEAATGKTLNNTRANVQITDGVAVIPVHGVIGKRMNLMTQISGGASTDQIANDYLSALNDPAVKGIVLHIDSPGGTVDGTMQLADILRANRGAKPTMACADGMMCSAAYWIGSAVDKITMADLTTDVGSIGVVASHMDISTWEEKQGIKTTEVTAGRYKRAISQYAALTEEGRAMLQADVDQIYQLFVESVASNRGCTVEDVLFNMADGRVFLGQKAIDAGLVDSVATLAETIQQVRDLSRTPQTKSISRASVAQATETEIKPMTIDQLKADHPELVEAIAAEATAGHAEALAAARAEGAAAEIQRINAVRACSIPGHEALVEQLAFDGTSQASDAALAIVEVEKAQRSAAATAADLEASPAVPAVDADDAASAKTMKRSDFNALNETDRRAALAAGTKIV